MGFNSICYREYGWRWRIYASSKFSTSIRSNGFYTAWSITGLGVFMIALVFGNLAIRKPELKAGPQSYAQAMFPSKKLVKLQDIVWHGDIGLLTGLQQHLLLFPLLDIYQHSFQFYKVSKFFFNKWIFTGARKRINFPRM